MDAPMPNLKLQSDAQNAENNEESNVPGPSVTNSFENSVKVEVKVEMKEEAKEWTTIDNGILEPYSSNPTAFYNIKQTKQNRNKLNTTERSLWLFQSIEKFIERKRGNKRKYSVLTEEEQNVPQEKMFALDKELQRLLSKLLRHIMPPIDYEGLSTFIIRDVQNRIVKLYYKHVGASDFQGITSAVEELFPNASFHIPFLSFLIIWNNSPVLRLLHDLGLHISLLLKPTTTKADESAEVDDLLCFTASVDISHHKQALKIYSQIRNDLMTLANKHATDSTNAKVKEILKNEHVPIVLLISYRKVEERTYMSAVYTFSSMKLCVKHYMETNKFATSAVQGYFVYICKKFKVRNKYTKKNKFIWLYSEEMTLAKKALYSFEYPVDPELFKLPGFVKSDDFETVMPYRQVLIFKSIEFQNLINELNSKGKIKQSGI